MANCGCCSRLDVEMNHGTCPGEVELPYAWRAWHQSQSYLLLTDLLTSERDQTTP